MGKETGPDFSTVTEQYNLLDIVDGSLFSAKENELHRTRTLRKYSLKSYLGIVKTNVDLVNSNGHSRAIKSQLYFEFAEVLRKEAEQFNNSPQGKTYYQYAALLYMNSAIENQGITEQNAHAVFHCLAEVASLTEENKGKVDNDPTFDI